LDGIPAGEVDLLRQHIDVLFRIDGNGLLAGLNEPGNDPAPRLFLARGRETHRICFRADVSAETVEACRTIARDLPCWDGGEPGSSFFDPLRAALAREAPIASETIGPAYRFGERVDLRIDADVRVIDETSAPLLERHFPYTRSVLAWRAPVAGIVVDGSVVSACFSARRGPTACEAGAATEEPYRGHGFASLVVAAWRDAVQSEGRQPLYSTTWDNLASRGVARRLHLVPYADTFSLA
jgi:hypothetical protein